MLIKYGNRAITRPGVTKEESLGAKAIYEAKGRYIGGTGKFKGITGTSAFKQTWTLAQTTTQWESEYEVK